MADLTSACRTPLSGGEVLNRAVAFFSSYGWRVRQSSIDSHFLLLRKGIGWKLQMLLVLGFMCVVIPGMVLYWWLVKRSAPIRQIRFAVTVVDRGSELVVTFPRKWRRLVDLFMDSLPTLTAGRAAS